ncbi:MAG: hypothetical protein ABFD76_05065 [Smithella sp.]
MTPQEWILSDDTGTSSKTIWAVMMGVVTKPGTKCKNNRYDIPYDPADFGRCYRLLSYFPDWRANIKKMGIIFPKWKPFADRWEEFEALYLEEKISGKAPKLYKLMEELTKEGMIMDG